MISTKARQGTSLRFLAFLAFLALIVAPALSWGDPKKDDKKPAPPPPKPAAAAPGSAATGHPSGQPSSAQGQQHYPGGPGTGTTPNGSKPTGGPGSNFNSPRQPNPPKKPPMIVDGPRKVQASPTGPARKIQTVQTPGGAATVSRRPSGGVATIQTKGMTITHPLRGPTTVVAQRNGSTIVVTGRQGGYVQHAYLNRNGRSYVQRTYVVGGRTYVSVYRSYSYGGYGFYGYAPAYYYHPVFYGWAYNPWGAPVVYGPAAWGWAGAPWYGYYGGYFAPYPAYASASQWLTDYLLAANLQAAYAANAEAQAAAANGPGAPAAGDPAATASRQTQLSPEVKQMIAEEVKQQLAAAQSSATSKGAVPSGDQLPDALNPAERIFVVSSHLDVTNKDGKECGLAPGDVVMRMTDSPDANQLVSASVQSSKKADCAAGQTVAIGVQDLQEMHNQFRQQLDSGLQTLAANAGKGGLPQAPDTTTVSGEVPAPTPDSTAAAQLANTQREAEAADHAVQQAGSGG
ncbi:MAG TPA: hypothetical protein VJA16_08260 [Thermoanaerobaculia bacterium]